MKECARKPLFEGSVQERLASLWYGKDPRATSHVKVEEFTTRKRENERRSERVVVATRSMGERAMVRIQP